MKYFILKISFCLLICVHWLYSSEDNVLWMRRGLVDEARQVEFSHDGTMIAIQVGNNHVDIFNIRTQDLIQLEDNRIDKPINGLFFMDFDQNDIEFSTVYLTDSKSRKQKWDMVNGKLLNDEILIDSVSALLAVSPNFKYAAMLDNYLFVTLVDLETNEIIKSFSHEIWAYDFAFSPDNTKLAIVNQSELILYDIQSDDFSFKKKITAPGYPKLIFSSDGSRIIRFYNTKAYVHNSDDGEQSAQYDIDDGVEPIRAAEGKKTILLSGTNGVFEWNFESGDSVNLFCPEKGRYYDFLFGDSTLCAVSDDDVDIYNYQTNEIIQTFEVSNFLYYTRFTLNSDYLVSGTSVFNAETGEFERRLKNGYYSFVPRANKYYDIDYPPKEDTNTFRVMNVFDIYNEDTCASYNLEDSFYYILTSNDLKYARTSSYSNYMLKKSCVIDLENEENILTLDYSYIYSFSDDNKYIVTREDTDDSLFYPDRFRIRELTTGAVIFEDFDDELIHIRVAPDEEKFYCVMREDQSSIIVRNIESGELINTIFSGDSSDIYSYRFTYDEKYIIVVKNPGIIRFINVQTGDIEYEMNDFEYYFDQTRVSYDFKKLFVVYEDGLAVMWDIDGIMKNNVAPRKEEDIIRAYPNPADGEVNLQFVLFNPSLVNTSVFDCFGNLVFEQSKTFLPGSHNIEIDLDEYKSGIYYCRMYSGEFNKHVRFIVVK